MGVVLLLWLRVPKVLVDGGKTHSDSDVTPVPRSLETAQLQTLSFTKPKGSPVRHRAVQHGTTSTRTYGTTQA